MTNAELVRNVLDESGLEETSVDLVVEDVRDGSAVVRHEAIDTLDEAFPVTDELSRAADALSDAGFVIALVKDDDGVHINARSPARAALTLHRGARAPGTMPGALFMHVECGAGQPAFERAGSPVGPAHEGRARTTAKQRVTQPGRSPDERSQSAMVRAARSWPAAVQCWSRAK